MTTVSGIIRDTQGNPLPALSVTIRYARPLVGFNGGAAVQNTRSFVTNGAGLLTMADLVPGHYEIFISIQVNDATSATLLQNGTMTVLDQATQTLESALDAHVGAITPNMVQQAIAAAEAAAGSAGTALETANRVLLADAQIRALIAELLVGKQQFDFTATEGQTVFTLTNDDGPVAYPAGAGSLEVTVNGATFHTPSQYIESDPDGGQIEMVEPLGADYEVTVVRKPRVAVPSFDGMSSGQNPDGMWFRFENGLQLCMSPLLGPVDVNVPNGAMFQSANVVWEYPAEFLEEPFAQGQGLNLNVDFRSVGTASPLTQASLRGESAVVRMGVQCRGFAIGRWKVSDAFAIAPLGKRGFAVQRRGQLREIGPIADVVEFSEISWDGYGRRNIKFIGPGVFEIGERFILRIPRRIPADDMDIEVLPPMFDAETDGEDDQSDLFEPPEEGEETQVTTGPMLGREVRIRDRDHPIEGDTDDYNIRIKTPGIERFYAAFPNAIDRRGRSVALVEELTFERTAEGWDLVRMPEKIQGYTHGLPPFTDSPFPGDESQTGFEYHKWGDGKLELTNGTVNLHPVFPDPESPPLPAHRRIRFQGDFIFPFRIRKGGFHRCIQLTNSTYRRYDPGDEAWVSLLDFVDEHNFGKPIMRNTTSRFTRIIVYVHPDVQHLITPNDVVKVSILVKGAWRRPAEGAYVRPLPPEVLS